MQAQLIATFYMSFQAKIYGNKVSNRHWATLGRSSTTRKLTKKDFKVSYRKPPSLKDMLVKAKKESPTCCCPIQGMSKTTNLQIPQQNSGTITKLIQQKKNCHTILNGTCQSNNLIYCLECK